MVQNLDEFASKIKAADPTKLHVTEDDAYAMAEDILEDIPEEMRSLLPENDILAAIAYAPVYYNTYPFGRRNRK